MLIINSQVVMRCQSFSRACLSPARKDLPMHENLQYDFYYIRNRCLALDASILIRTAWAVFSRRGAF